MKVFWVLGYYSYYPSADNFFESFETKKEAEEYVDKCRENDAYQHYDIIDISSRL